MNAHTWVSLGRHDILARVRPWPTWISVRERAKVHACLFVYFDPLLHGFLCSLFLGFAVFESFAILLRFYCSMCFACLFVWVCVCFLLFFSFVRFSLFGFCFTSCFYFSAGKFCCTRAMLFYCFLPQGHWFFFTLILLFFVNVHYLEDCTLRECLQSRPPVGFRGFARVYSGTFQGFAVRFTTFKSESSCEGGRFLFFTSE